MRRFLALSGCTIALSFGFACGSRTTSGGSDASVAEAEDAGDGGSADAGGLTCAERLGSAYESSETRCDGIDNDCDGLTDVRTPTLVIPSPPVSAGPGWWHSEFFASANGFLFIGPYARFIELDVHGHPTGVSADFSDAGFYTPLQFRPHVARYGDQLALLQGQLGSPYAAWRIDVDDRLQQTSGQDGGVRAVLVGTNVLGGSAAAWSNVVSKDGTRLLHIFGDFNLNQMWLALTWTDGGTAVAAQRASSDGGVALFVEGYSLDGGFLLAGYTGVGYVLRRVDLELAQVGADQPLVPRYPNRSQVGFLPDPGSSEPAILMHFQYPPELAIWRAPYTPATWSEWYDELAFQGLRRGLIAYNEDPPLAVAMTASSNPGNDGGPTRLIAATLDGGHRVLLEGPDVGLLYPDVINTDAGTFLVSFEYLPRDGGTTGIYTMEICAP